MIEGLSQNSQTEKIWRYLSFIIDDFYSEESCWNFNSDCIIHCDIYWSYTIYSLKNIILTRFTIFELFLGFFVVLTVKALTRWSTSAPIRVTFTVFFYAFAFAAIATSCAFYGFREFGWNISTASTATIRWTLSSIAIAFTVVFNAFAFRTITAVLYHHLLPIKKKVLLLLYLTLTRFFGHMPLTKNIELCTGIMGFWVVKDNVVEIYERGVINEREVCQVVFFLHILLHVSIKYTCNV